MATGICFICHFDTLRCYGVAPNTIGFVQAVTKHPKVGRSTCEVLVATSGLGTLRVSPSLRARRRRFEWGSAVPTFTVHAPGQVPRASIFSKLGCPSLGLSYKGL